MADPASNLYCTVFDSAYLPQALALHASLVAASPAARFAFVCMDSLSAELVGLLAPARARILTYADLATPELDRARSERSYGEAIWTCKAYAILRLAQIEPDAPWVVYVDADTACFGDPNAALAGSQSHYVLAPHRYHPAFQRFAASAGHYNAGYVAMRNSAEGVRAIEWWRDRCLESCSAVPTADTYADQLYLDRMPGLFPYGESSAHEGLNAAPWNIENHVVTGGPDGEVRLDRVPLLLYHFQSLRVLNAWLVDLYAGDRRLSGAVRELIYLPYLARLNEAHRALRAAAGARAPGVPSRLNSLLDWLRLARGVMRGRHNLLLRRIAS